MKLAWLRRYCETERRAATDGGMIFISWDTAVKAHDRANYSVATVWARYNRRHYLLHVFRGRLEYPELKKKAHALHQQFRASKTFIEDAAAGVQLLQELGRYRSNAFVGVKPSADKATRLMGVTPIIEAGDVLLPETAPWLADFEHELSLFPAAKHDDQVDSLSQYLEWQKRFLPGIRITARVCT